MSKDRKITATLEVTLEDIEKALHMYLDLPEDTKFIYKIRYENSGDGCQSSPIFDGVTATYQLPYEKKPIVPMKPYSI